MSTFDNISNKKVSPKKEFASLIKDQFEMYDLLLKCWTSETCSPSLRDKWNAKTNYTCGQCSITSFLVQDYFGGNVYAVKIPGGGLHCFNEVNRCKFDLTSEQFFGEKLNYDECYLQDREETFKNVDKYNRYLLLKKNLEELFKNKKKEMTNNLLEVNHVSKSFEKFKLDDLSFNVPSGAIVGFIGRNGAGKTTALKGIMNLVHFDSGSVKAFGKDLRETELEAKQNIGFALSELSYYPNKRIKDLMNVTKRFYKNFSNEKYDKLCKLFNLDINKKLEELSSGMKVKFSLATALSYDAKLLILDEPTSGLDPVSRDEIIDIFESIVKKEGRGILFSTHITSDLDKAATHIVYIKNGKKIYEGTKSDFINCYFLVEGEASLFNKDTLISYKETDSSLRGMIEKDKLSLFENKEGINISKPDLEEIMVFMERDDSDEKFDL